MAAQIHFTVSDEVHADMFEVAKQYGLSVSQYARLVFLSNRYMNESQFRAAVSDDLDRRERERRERDEARRVGHSRIRRVDGGGWVD